MAPEQERGDAVSDRADIYSLGLTLYEMVTGRHPSSRERVLQTSEAGVEIRQQLAPLAPSLAELICRCLLADPGARPSAGDCAQELRLGSALTMARPGARKSDARDQRRQPAILAGLGILAVVMVGGVYALWPRVAPLHTAAPASAIGSVSSSGLETAALSEAPTPTPAASLQAPEPRDNLTVASDAAAEAPKAGANDTIVRACGRGDPHTLLSTAITRGLRAKVQLTLAADQGAQREAAATLRHEIACLESLSREGFKSTDAERLQEDAKPLLEGD